MDQQTYLYRLNNIREKYNVRKDFHGETRNNREQASKSPMLDFHIKKCHSIEKESRRNMSIFEESRQGFEEQKFSRKISNSLNKANQFFRDQDRPSNKPSINRSDFSTFIKDLDKKIQQKERFLRQKLNQKEPKYNAHIHGIQNEWEMISPIRRKPQQRQNTQYLPKQTKPKELERSILISKSHSKLNYQANLHPTQLRSQKTKKNYDDEEENRYLRGAFINKNQNNQGQLSRVPSNYLQKIIDHQKLNSLIETKLSSQNNREKYHPLQQSNNSFCLHSKQNSKSPFVSKNYNHQFTKNDWNSNNFQKIQQKIRSALKPNNR